MVRSTRVEFAGATYHVMNRGAGSREVFGDTDDHLLFLDLLREAAQRFSVEIHAWCLMGNHYHLLVRTPQPNLGDVMHHVAGCYTRRYNSRHSTDGPLFRSRYKALLVASDANFLSVSRYIHLNPVEVGLAPRPEAYRWSSYRHLVENVAAPRWLHRGLTLSLAGGRGWYRDFVTAGDGGDQAEPEPPQPEAGDDDDDDGLSSYQPCVDVSLDSLDETVCASFETPRPELYRSRRGARSDGRMVAIALAYEFGARPADVIAPRYGLANADAVRSAARRLRARRASDPALARLVSDIVHQLEAR